jgi:hypothetical protein
MMTMIVEDIAVVAVIALFIWLVPVRRNGIPGLRGRGRPPACPVPATDRDRERDVRALAELDSTWDAGYADRVAAQVRTDKNSA